MSDDEKSDWLDSAGYKSADDVVQRQFAMLASTIPVLYLGFFLSAFTGTAIVAVAAPLHVALLIPLVFLALASWRIPFWLKQRHEKPSVPEMRRQLRRVTYIVPISSAVLAIPASGLTAVFGTEHLSLAIVACIAVSTIVSGSTYTMLPIGAIAMFAAVQPALYFPAVWHQSALIFGLAVLSSGVSVSQAFIILRQYSLVVRLVESERQAAENLKKAASIEHIKAQFISGMGHEIRTPLNGVLGMAELLSRSKLDARQRGFVSVIIDSGNRLLSTINNILDYSRIDAGLLTLDIGPFRLADAIEDIVHEVSTRAAKKRIELIQRIDPNLPEYVCGDASRLRQALKNLIDNAVKFTDTGYVLVDASGSVSHGTACITIRVEDTGSGIAAERLPEIFRHFAQAGDPASRRYEGTGLGLGIAARLVHLMDGEVGVESEAGDGSTFWMTIPFKIHEVTEVPRHVPIDVSGARVLVIDDNEVNRSIMTEQLKHWEFDCVAVESGPIGLAVIEHAIEMDAPVDCVVLDYQMPGMNGGEIARALRGHPLMRDIPLIMLSSADDRELDDLDLKPGLAARLTKPARSAELRNALVEAVHNARNRVVPPPAPGPEARKVLQAEKDEWIARARSAAHRAASAVDIVVAEDNEVNQIVFNQILDLTDLSYKTVPNGRKAVEAYLQYNPEIILMDVDMPEMDGLEATQQIRQIERDASSRVTIIGVTARALHHEQQAALDAGMDDCIAKPISPQMLLEAIARAMPDNKQIGALTR